MRFIDAAQKVLDRFKVTSHPVPVKEIAEQLGAKVVFQPFAHEDRLSGVLFKDNGNVTIAINASDPATRQRFTIAHECGHLVLKHKGDIFVDQTIRLHRDDESRLAADPFEMEANGFAAELLMPRAWVLEEFEKRLKVDTPPKPDLLIKGLAASFEVSPKAMEYRLENLGLLSPDH